MDDNTNSGTCASEPKTECFFQVLAIHVIESERTKIQSIHFSQNYVNISGSTLYGGLLDRCAVSQFAEVQYKNKSSNGVCYFKDISSGGSILTSYPVRVCLCISNEHDCTHQSHIEVKKGEIFTISLVAVDQIGQPVNGTIQTSLSFAESGLAEGQLARKIPAECTSLTFNVVSSHDLENLTLYASDGPCKDADLSTRTIEIHFQLSSWITSLIGKKNPVPTLATLILLSYAKLLEICLSLYQLAFLSILISTQVKCCNSLMRLSNTCLESTFLYSLQLFSFSLLVWSTLLFSSPGSGSSTFQGGEFSGGQGIQRYKLLSKPTTHLTLPIIATGLDYC